MDLTIIGGGAAGIFTALAAKQNSPASTVLVLEKSAVLLSKVRVSGGGRCNVTHACFDPKRLIENYPRGQRELLGPFHAFQPRDTIEWFEKRGVHLKTESDGRMFPITDSSSTIIDCLLTEAGSLQIPILLRQKIVHICKINECYEILFADGEKLLTKKLVLATGSSKEGHEWASQLGHTIKEPVPSLFTFNIPHSPLNVLSGISLDSVEIALPEAKLSQRGPLLITHFGLSGPAVLKLSAWGARFLHSRHYQTEVILNWFPDQSEEQLYQVLKETKENFPQKLLSVSNPFNLPKNLWKAFTEDQKLISLPDKNLRKLVAKLHRDIYQIEGKTTHKEEFVTCGGVSLNEINFKTMESKLSSGLFFAGEILDIDGVTGGFNFQNAWTTASIAGKNACS